MKSGIVLILSLLIGFSGLAQGSSQAQLQLSMKVLFDGSIIPEGALVPGPVDFFIHPDVTTTMPVHAGDTVMIDFFDDGKKLTSAKALWRDATTTALLPGQTKPEYKIPAQFIVPNCRWTNVPVGSHLLSIRAYNFHGLSASVSLHVTVLPPLPRRPVSGTHTLTGKQRPPFKPELVRIAHAVPGGTYEVIGTVTARAPGTKQQDELDALGEIKKQAAEMGANCVIVGQTHRSDPMPYSGSNGTFVVPETRVSGQAVYLP